MAVRERDRTLSIRLDDTELAMLHDLAADESIASMLRRWTRERWRAARGDAAPPPAKTKHGDHILPTKTSR